METFDAVILGAGPSGLTAAYRLAKSGKKIAVVERAPQVGGLMRGVKRGDFNLDMGRKELYARLPEVDALWREILGDDYRSYPHHVGLLYEGRILEQNSKHKGKLRGLSPSQVVRLLLSYLAAQVKPGSRRATNHEEWYLLKYGRAYHEAFHRGFLVKFMGEEPTTMPAPFGVQVIPRFSHFRKEVPPETPPTGPPPGSILMKEWRHPARGTGQIVDALEAGARAAGARFFLNTEVVALDVEGGRARSVTIRENGVETELVSDNIVVGIPVPLVMPLLRPAPPDELRTPPNREVALKRSAVLVYLLLDEPPRFPHNWLEVNDPTLSVGRIVNYATWNGEMVPPGKTALCLEYFCLLGDPILSLSNDELVALAKKEAASAKLIDPAKVFDSFVFKLPMANASTTHDDWKVRWMKDATSLLHNIQGLHETNRPGMDYASLAGIDAAAACVSGGPMSPRSLEDAYSA